MSKRRILKELDKISRDPPEFCSAGPIDNDIYHWHGTIQGPPDTPFEGGIFELDIVFPEDYPFKPPQIKFLTKVFHPNITEDGTIHVSILKEDWQPEQTISTILISLCSFLDDPNPNISSDPHTGKVAHLYRTDREEYNRQAREWTKLYASGITE